MGNMCQEQKHDGLPPSRLKDQQTILSAIRQYQDPTEDMRQFLSLTSQNTPSCDFEEIRKKRNQRCINNFKAIRVLGQGSFGKVMLVQDSVDNVLYAMKIIEKKNVKTKEEKRNTFAERLILEAMDHPFVVKLHYAFQNSKKLYLFVDFMGGGELFYLLRLNRMFQEDIAAFYAAELLLALEYLHSRNIIYRDMKPENILLDQEGHIKIADFGLSKICRNETETTFSVCGTPEYISPEVIMREGYNRNADWFSFGSVIYDMLTGKPPFYSKNKNETLKNLCTKQVPLPQHLSQNAKSLLRGLFSITASKRLGANGSAEIKSHPFFAKINFELLIQKGVKPPFGFNEAINMQGFDNKLKQKVALDSLKQESKVGEFYDDFTYQKPNYSEDVIQRTLENSKAFTLEYIDLNAE